MSVEMTVNLEQAIRLRIALLAQPAASKSDMVTKAALEWVLEVGGLPVARSDRKAVTHATAQPTVEEVMSAIDTLAPLDPRD